MLLVSKTGYVFRHVNRWYKENRISYGVKVGVSLTYILGGLHPHFLGWAM